MGIINVLPTEISNKIAAGEVVERPASVIKELVENAIDAGATVITVEIRKGGITYMRVSDNGKGMERDDAAAAFLRHATSKIKNAEDLDAIYTLGFRGEALSSIGAVSQSEIYTKRREDETGTHVVCAGGEITSCDDAGIPDGTVFTVYNLFYNTPARMNFLKRDATEAAAVTDIIERFILSHPEISFRYTVDGKEKYFTAGDNSLTNCIYAVYGKNYAKSVISVDYETELVKITGMIGKGDAARPNRSFQSYFVNRRYIKSPLICKALESAYKNQIMIGKYPMAVLNLEINPRFIDINVHPTKLEVKFSQESEIYRAVFHAAENALYALPNVPKIEHIPSVKSEFVRDEVSTKNQLAIDVPKMSGAPKKAEHTERAEKIRDIPRSVTEAPVPKNATKPPEAAADEKTESYALDASNEYFLRRQGELLGGGVSAQQAAEENDSRSADWLGHKDEPRDAETAIYEVRKDTPDTEEKPAEEAVKSDSWGFDSEEVRVIGQLFDTYIIAQSGDTMIICDQHAAHERLKYEELKRELKKREVTSQMLLAPIAVDLSPSEFAVYTENAENLSEMGFETEAFGDTAVLVRATPEALDAEDLKDLIIEILGNFADNRGGAVSQKKERALYTIACKAAVKANHSFDLKQLEMLLGAVLDLNNINTCPHGRPIIVTMTKKELEKEFKRIV